MRRLWSLAGSFVWATVASGVTAAYHADFYAEQSYQSRIEQSATSLRVRNEFLHQGALSAYGTLGAELQNFDQARFSGPGDNYLYFTPGIKAALGALSLYLEPRVRYFPDPKSTDKTADLRWLAVYGRYMEGPAMGSLVSFGELYFDGLITSADSWNLVGNAFLRTGLRYKFSPTTFADLFVEPFIALDRIRHYYNNRSDIKLTLRLQSRFDGLQLGLQTSLIKNSYFSRGDFEANPFKENNVGFRILGVVGGLW